MRLATELIAYGCSETPQAFRELLIATLLNEFPERSIDSLVCRPPDALTYCNKIRKAISSNPPDVVILKTLMNIRRAKSSPTGLKSPRTKKHLKIKLDEVGCTIDVKLFRDLLTDCLADMYHCRTIDEILCHPPEAAALCNYVRIRSKSEVLTDELILTTLLNNRKSN